MFYGRDSDIRSDVPGIERLLERPEPSAEEIAAIDAPSRRMARLWHLFGDSSPLASRFVARGELKSMLAEVQAYLANRDGIADRIKSLLYETLADAWDRGERIMLIGHSLGSVIAYECLSRISRHSEGEHKVDLFVSLGSPLATRFIRLAVDGADGHGRLHFPACVGRWLNFSARGELTALHPRLEPFVVGSERGAVEDHADIYNHFYNGQAMNVHKSYGYLANPEFARSVADWLLAGG